MFSETLQEHFDPAARIGVLKDGSLQIREATTILRDGAPDPGYPPRYHRYVLRPGDDLADRHPRVAKIAAAAWTPEAIAARRAADEPDQPDAGGGGRSGVSPHAIPR